MNVVLLGCRGTGKTVLSKLLARELKREVFRLDDLIVQSAGMPIPQIIEEGGWPRFREIESRIVREVTDRHRNGIIDCGGGVVLDDQNIACLKREGKAVLLTVQFDTLLQRIRHDANRPPLKGGLSLEEELKQTLAEREKKYLSAADMVCDTTDKSPEQTAREIIDTFKKNSWI